MDIVVRHHVGACRLFVRPSRSIQYVTELAVDALTAHGLQKGDIFELMHPGAGNTLDPKATVRECKLQDGQELELLATGSNI